MQNELKNILNWQFSRALNSIDVDWTIEIDSVDVDKQTLLFYYPTLSQKTNNAYIRPAVKIELGARGDGNPFNLCNISPFIQEDISNAHIISAIQIKTLAAGRTFWEKATILHMYSNWPENKTVPLRQSRHFFDFYKLITSDIKNLAMQEDNLFQRVVEHKKIYFRAGWANYDNSKGSELAFCLSIIIQLLSRCLFTPY